MSVIKAITISQPFASLIADGEKFVENRTWETDYRGPLAIHAGKGTQYLTKRELEDYITGAVIATADVVACVNVASPSEVSIQELEGAGFTLEQVLRHRHCEGPFAWVLSGVRKADNPVFVNGKQKLWDFRIENHEDLAF